MAQTCIFDIFGGQLGFFLHAHHDSMLMQILRGLVAVPLFTTSTFLYTSTLPLLRYGATIYELKIIIWQFLKILHSRVQSKARGTCGAGDVGGEGVGGRRKKNYGDWLQMHML
jgi:hypothetical protein